MKTAVVRAFGLFASVLVAGVASAQSTQAVEWKVSEGGNGHWYRRIDTAGNISWTGADAGARALGGHLISITSASEQAWAFQTLLVSKSGCREAWIGLYQDRTASDYSEPAGGWRWTTGESVNYSNWQPGEPNNVDAPADFALMYGHIGTWDDSTVNHYIYCTEAYLVEWSSDCNGDGIVDYGQIQRGELIDLNGNGVPDICETSVSSVLPPSVPAQGGSTITIRGNGFQANPTVLIGGVPATNVVRVSLTQITATSPALLPGMASVQVNGFTLQDAIYIRPECGSDLDQDGEVTAADIAIVLLDFGPCYSNAAAPEPDSSTPFMLREDPAPAAPQSR